ncbi:putative bifunctional diguanylate cyclase/phosphodiesterase [Altererythrobacter sp. GH1-8]|uniref:putative bifunctional diguanylate cyclase/phosphodiesterase n=1 Tax=Altererythrobacter sp. GH1-8 TaxID=3349333 RepID=UPI00374D904F
MSEIVSPEPHSNASLSYFDVLGLDRSDYVKWAKLRGLQYSALPQVSRYRMVAHLLFAVVVVQIYFADVWVGWLGLWYAALAMVHVRGVRFEQTLIDADRRVITQREFNRQTLTGVLSGALWAVPLVGFSAIAGEAELLVAWSLVAIIILGSAVFNAAAPLATIAYTAITGSAAALAFLYQGQVEMAALSANFVVFAILGATEVARTYLRLRLAESGVEEKQHVVSLLLREFEENEADWLWEVDTARRLRAVSPRFAYALAHKQDEVEGRPLLELIAGKGWKVGNFPPSLHELAERLKRRENFSNLIVHVSIRGEERWWELSGTPMRDEYGQFSGFRGVGSDVTEQRRSSEKIAYLARYDTLTSLPNRTQLTEALGEALHFAEHWRGRCAFLMIDLDRFKSVNDSLGHQTGDRLLAQVSHRLQSLMTDNNLCGRLGGDEFAIVMREVSDTQSVAKLANRVIERLSEPYVVDNHTLYVGASVGSAIGPRDGCTVEELMRNADLALYRAKDQGGGEHFAFEPVLHAFAEERRRLEVSLRGALARDELLLHYQPVVDANDESIVSFEALVRWNSADHGFVSPGKFIPLAEDTRLIVPIGRWVLRKACEQAGKWPDHIKVNVNVSPEQLLEPNFADEVVDVLASTGLRPERLEIEVTESIFLRDPTVARSALEQAMALGCSVALDDFGTGYSSLGYLRKLRFSTIKVDRTFVQGAAQHSAESLAIVRAVVAMAQSLDMTTTAEGVENAEEARMIRELGCDKIQGFHFGRPMSADDTLKLFANPPRKRA